MPKPRSDSKLDSLLTDQQREELRARLCGGMGYVAAIAWMHETFDVVVNLASLAKFWKRHCEPWVRDRRRFAVVRAEALGSAMEKDPVNWDTAIIEKTKQLAFEFLDADNADPDAVKKLLDAILKAQKQELDARKVDLMERKARQADEAREVLNRASLSQDEQNRRIREILK